MISVEYLKKMMLNGKSNLTCTTVMLQCNLVCHGNKSLTPKTSLCACRQGDRACQMTWSKLEREVFFPNFAGENHGEKLVMEFTEVVCWSLHTSHYAKGGRGVIKRID